MSVDFLDYNLASNYLEDTKKTKVFRQKRGMKSPILGSDRKKNNTTGGGRVSGIQIKNADTGKILLIS